jgi:1-acyl-sn-glycerol-3-phosphate acyltransferase
MLPVLRAALFTDPLIALDTIVMGTLSMIASLFDATGFTQHRIARLWARLILLVAGMRVEVEGLEKIEPGGLYVLVSNHLSLTDTPVLMALIPLQFRFFAKQGLFRIPFLGGHLRRAGHLPVVHDDARAGLRTLAHGARLVRERGVSILIFPEGGRSHDGTLKPFQGGAAYVAIKAGVPCLPIAISGTREILPMGSVVVRPGPVRVAIGDPIPTEGLKMHDHARLTEELYRRIAQLAPPPAPLARGQKPPVQCF